MKIALLLLGAMIGALLLAGLHLLMQTSPVQVEQPPPLRPNGKDVGILYEVWHAWASTAMRNVKKAGGQQLTTEVILRSNGKLTLDDVYKKYKLSGDIYNVEP